MTSLEKIRVPTAFIIGLSYIVILFSPLCPVQVRVTEWSACTPPGQTCTIESERWEVQPTILVTANGFSWKTAAATSNAGTNHSFSAHPAIAVAFLVLPLVPTFLLMLRAKGAGSDAGGGRRWSHFILPRRPWRTFLWGVGLCLLLLSALWAWGYLIFYGGLESTAAIDPLLTSTIGTFLLMGLGFTAMMLSVRSRAIWQVRTARDD
jgi:hypothetical protein